MVALVMSGVLLLPVTTSPVAAASEAPDPGWDWGACLPDQLRRPASITQLRNPFARTAETGAPTAPAPAELPEQARAALERFSRQIRACLAEPRPLLLAGARVLEPGDELLLPDGDRIDSRRTLRAQVQRIDAEGATLIVWSRGSDGQPRQIEVMVRPQAAGSHPGGGAP
jgi:hypothetical protein